MRNTSVIVEEGVNCLLDKLGSLETEIFISYFLREPFDYTKWRRNNLYENLSLSELNKKAAEFARESNM
jgi:hypothetical protein